MSKIRSGLFTIVLSDAEGSSAPPKVQQILRVGKWQDDGWHGEFEITPDMLQDFVKNFEANVLRRDVSTDYFHDGYGIASGWYKRVFISDDGQSLMAEIEWTDKAAESIKTKELKYFSSEFEWEFKDVETGEIFKHVLTGGGLTNRPFIKGMKPMAASEENTMTLDDAKKKIETLEANVKQFSDGKKLDESRISELEKLIADLQAELKDEKEKAELAEKASKLAERESKFNVMLSEGRACAAQKDAYMKNDMDKFMELAETPNLKGTGTGNSATTEADREKKVVTLADEKIKGGMSRRDAYLAANKEIPK